MTGGQEHWDEIYATGNPQATSWHQTVPATSVRLVTDRSQPTASVVDVGGGVSTLVDHLLAAGYRDLTVVDVSDAALARARARVTDPDTRVAWIRSDVLEWKPERRFDVWHDRATFHFLVDPNARAKYVKLATAALPLGGSLIVGSFGPDGPETCSGLPTARYDAEGLADEFAASFELAHHEREMHTTPAGVVQPFTWVVLKRV